MVYSAASIKLSDLVTALTPSFLSPATVTVRPSKILESLPDWIAISYFDFELGDGPPIAWNYNSVAVTRVQVGDSPNSLMSAFQIPNTKYCFQSPTSLQHSMHSMHFYIPFSIAFRLYCDWWIPVHHVLLTAAVPDFSRDKSTSYKFQISISDTFDISLRAIRPPQASLTNWGVELHRTSSDVHNPCPQVINKSRYHFTPKVKKLLVMWILSSYSEVDGIPRV